jgi:hypothetical protein
LHQDSKFVAFVKSAFRVALMTGVFTLIGFAIGLFCGIMASVLFGAIRHIHPDMTMAYKYVAVPFGIGAFVITFCVMVFIEIRDAVRPAGLARTSALRRTS